MILIGGWLLPLTLSAIALRITLKTRREMLTWRKASNPTKPGHKDPAVSKDPQRTDPPPASKKTEPRSFLQESNLKPSSSVRNRKMRLGEKIAAYLPFDRSTGNNKTTQKLSTNSLEVFMGARLFAWIGGLAFFFAICFFVKYSFDNNLVPPWLRIALGYITSTALLGGGLFLNRKPYKITSHTLCGTGIVGLYAVTFAAHGIYQFGLFSPALTFFINALVTSGAILLAHRWGTQVVAALGMLGGFLTPQLLDVPSTSALFSYIALLNIGILIISIRQQWCWMTWATSLGTAFYLTFWVIQQPPLFPWGTAAAIMLPFGLIFMSAETWKQTVYPRQHSMRIALKIPSFASLGLCLYVIQNFPDIEMHAAWIACLILSIYLVLMWQSFNDSKGQHWASIQAGITFLVLSAWASHYAEPAMSVWIIGACLLFGLIQSAFLFIQLHQARSTPVSPWSLCTPLLTLCIVCIGILQSSVSSFATWTGVMLLDVIFLCLAFASGSLALILGTVALTMGIFGAWILSVPPGFDSISSMLIWIMLFCGLIMFTIQNAPRWIASLGRSMPERTLTGLKAVDSRRIESMQFWGQAYASVLPFFLLLGVIGHLELPTTHWIMVTSWLLSAMVCWNSRQSSWLAMAGLLSSLAVQYAWVIREWNTSTGHGILAWIVAHYLLFLISPFVIRFEQDRGKGAWITAALSGVGHFVLLHIWTEKKFDLSAPGLIPLAFACVTFFVLRNRWKAVSREIPEHRTVLAWFGGVTSLFITLIFPVQWNHEWLTIGWALEGAALIWIYRHIAHQGLIAWGVALLALSFVRLGLNPSILDYYPRGNFPILNWYLYTYALVIGSLLIGARTLESYTLKEKVKNLPAWLYGMAVFLTFILMNIEIADFFAKPGEGSLVFEFRGNIARDLCYSVAWSIFAFVLIAVGIARRLGGARKFGLGLFACTIFKVFMHDISHLDQLYRVGALVGIAVATMLASFLYQKYSKRLEQEVSSMKSETIESP